MKHTETSRWALLSSATILALALTACSGGPNASHDTSSSDSHDNHDHGAAVEVAAQAPRVVMTYNGGLLVIDATTLEEVADIPLEGFARIAPAGDGRHVIVSTAGGWAPLDAGTWAQGHGEHSHYFTAEPQLHEVLVAAETPGHVVVHDDLTALFDEGTGEVTVVPTESWTEAVEHDEITPTRTYTAPSPHHGVAVARANGGLLITRGTEDAGTGAQLLNADNTIVAASDQCPGVHGEGTTEDYLMVGCEDGILVFHGDNATKIASPDAFGRIGNVFPSDGSIFVLGDYKTDPEAGLGLTQITITDLITNTMSVIDSGTEYTWRGLARGEGAEVLILGIDGSLRVLDPATGSVTHTIPVIDPWTVPTEWQEAHPGLLVTGGMAYVSDPVTQQLHIVDYAAGNVWKSGDLAHAPIEMTPATS